MRKYKEIKMKRYQFLIVVLLAMPALGITVISCATGPYKEFDVSVDYTEDRENKYLDDLCRISQETGFYIKIESIDITHTKNPTIDWDLDSNGEIELEIETNEYSYEITTQRRKGSERGVEKFFSAGTTREVILKYITSIVNRYL